MNAIVELGLDLSFMIRREVVDFLVQIFEGLASRRWDVVKTMHGVEGGHIFLRSNDARCCFQLAARVLATVFDFVEVLVHEFFSRFVLNLLSDLILAKHSQCKFHIVCHGSMYLLMQLLLDFTLVLTFELVHKRVESLQLWLCFRIHHVPDAVVDVEGRDIRFGRTNTCDIPALAGCHILRTLALRFYLEQMLVHKPSSFNVLLRRVRAQSFEHWRCWNTMARHHAEREAEHLARHSCLHTESNATQQGLDST
mmetsp:Transcript_30321/g.46549  ORF Transcript_30321/g.46549 Transcript_30321/m.46549 type:complete len:253 (+) Transcript_30321:336-1094(+)